MPWQDAQPVVGPVCNAGHLHWPGEGDLKAGTGEQLLCPCVKLSRKGWGTELGWSRKDLSYAEAK